MNMTLKCTAVVAFFLNISSTASAYSYWSGKMQYIFFSGPGNYAFRVTPDSTTPFPITCAGNFAFVDTSNPNYQVYVSSLMTAFAQGKTVDLTISVDASGFCTFLEGGVHA